MGSDPSRTSGGYGGGGVRSAASQAADRVSGTASSAASSVQDAASSAAGTVQDAASTAADAVQQAPQAIRRQTRGNPLAAGLIAFGAGWLVSSLLPASRREQELADQAKQVAQEKVQPVAAAGGRRGRGQPARAGAAGRRVGEGRPRRTPRRRWPTRAGRRPRTSGPGPGRRGHRPEQHERRLTPTCGGPAPDGSRAVAVRGERLRIPAHRSCRCPSLRSPHDRHPCPHRRAHCRPHRRGPPAGRRARLRRPDALAAFYSAVLGAPVEHETPRTTGCSSRPPAALLWRSSASRTTAHPSGRAPSTPAAPPRPRGRRPRRRGGRGRRARRPQARGAAGRDLPGLPRPRGAPLLPRPVVDGVTARASPARGSPEQVRGGRFRRACGKVRAG